MRKKSALDVLGLGGSEPKGGKAAGVPKPTSAALAALRPPSAPSPKSSKLEGVVNLTQESEAASNQLEARKMVREQTLTFHPHQWLNRR